LLEKNKYTIHKMNIDDKLKVKKVKATTDEQNQADLPDRQQLLHRSLWQLPLILHRHPPQLLKKPQTTARPPSSPAATTEEAASRHMQKKKRSRCAAKRGEHFLRRRQLQPTPPPLAGWASDTTPDPSTRAALHE
jgi:hypothetical protein